MKTFLVGGALGTLVFLVLSVMVLLKEADHNARWETSPCGTRLAIEHYMLGEYNYESDSRDYRDDGERVWRIKEIRFPKGFNPHIKKTAQVPEIVWEVAMERTPQACEAWIARTGIDRRPKEKK